MLINPNKSHGIVFRKEKSMYGYQGWPSLTKTDDGTLIAAYSGYRMQHICPFGKTVINRSYDEGKTWTPQIIINDSPLDDRDAGILSLGKNKLLITFFNHPASVMEKDYINNVKTVCSPDEALISLSQIASYKNLSDEQRMGGSFIKISEDGGITWSERIKIPVSAPHGPNKSADNTLIYLGKELYSEGEEEKGAIAFYTSPDGYKWSRVSKIEIPEGYKADNFHEPHVIELPGGRLFGTIRAQGSPVYHGFSIFTCYSDDKGITWTIPKCIDISGSPPHLMLHSSGALICSFGRREAPFGERAVVSYDGGETWTDEYDIDNCVSSGDLGYPASVELSDGSIFTLYYQAYPGDNKTSILYTIWNLKK